MLTECKLSNSMKTNGFQICQNWRSYADLAGHVVEMEVSHGSNLGGSQWFIRPRPGFVDSLIV